MQGKVQLGRTTLERGCSPLLRLFDGRRGDAVPDLELMVARLNIERYRRILQTETNPARRARIEALLAEEEAKLALLMQNRSDREGT